MLLFNLTVMFVLFVAVSRNKKAKKRRIPKKLWHRVENILFNNNNKSIMRICCNNDI